MLSIYVSQARIHDVEDEKYEKNDDQNNDENDDKDDAAVEGIMKTHSSRTDPLSLGTIWSKPNSQPNQISPHSFLLSDKHG